MFNTIKFLVLLTVISILLFGCSNGGNTPITPREPGAELTQNALPQISESGSQDLERNFDGMPDEELPDGNFESIGMFGSYQLSLNTDEMTAELFSARQSSIGESYIVSGIHFFDIRPCSDCLKVKSISLTPEGYIQLAFLVSHPFEKGITTQPPTAMNRCDLDVFDLALVVVPSDNNRTMFPLTGVQAYDETCVDTDGYTRELSQVIGNNYAYPYFLVMDDSVSGTSTYNKFEMGKKNVPFDTFFLSGGNFSLFLTMGYGASAKKSTRLNPTYYNPEFNRKASWKVEVIPPQGNDPPSIGNTWDDYYTNMPFDITVNVRDWQQDSIVATGYPDPTHRDQIYKSSKAASVSVEIPGMTALLKSTSTVVSGTGMPSSPLVYKISIANENKLPAGVYTGLVKVTDERVPPSSALSGQTDNIVNTPDGVALDWYSMQEFVTYQVFPATVVVGMKITVTYPNGFENWDVGSAQDVTWTSIGPVTNVKIDLSTDSGTSYTVPITASTPNSGTFHIPSVGLWTSGHCRIRVENVDDSTVNDISNNDFAVNCPLPPPPTTVGASDAVYYDRVRVNWNSVAGALSYNLYRNGALRQANITAITWDDMGPTPGVVFYYQVSTNDICGEGIKGPADPGEPGSACVLPATPTGLNASDGTYNDHVALTWNSATGASTYNVYRNNTLVQSSIAGTSWDDYGITRGVIYTYEVESQNTCGPSTSRSTSNTGYALGCAADSNNTCNQAVKTYLTGSVNGCVDQIDEDWYHFYVSPNGFTAASAIQLVITTGTLNIYIYGIDPGGGSCPGTLLHSVMNTGSATITMPASSTRSHIYIRLIGSSGMANYTMNLTFVPALTNLPVELYVARDAGNNWPANGGTPLDHATLLQMMTWFNNWYNPRGYNFVWDGTENFMASQYYVLSTPIEDQQMHDAYGNGTDKLCFYFVDQLYSGNTAYCYVFSNTAQHNVDNVFMVYSPNVWTWQNVMAHEDGHATGYLQDMYLYDQSPCASCACGDDVCLSNCLGWTQFLFTDPAGCYSGNQMYFANPAQPWSWYSFTIPQQGWYHEFNFTYPTNFPWY